ncbi:alpha/beta hydrolase [Streptomyces sp. NRRL S-31]|uniref:serine aminopeptidase domain-containing protein n=1 Tax=Streptomyces sp. NRRL S-31 TaxID=1463898 RepID=UPI0004C62AE8|nr:alpha/beta hydrolase [Streptomyces sp. NRRL S-31]
MAATGPRLLVLLTPGYGEHTGRHQEPAALLTGYGSAVYGPDHAGYGGRLTERIFPGARHEVFHETDRAAAHPETIRFPDRVLPR